MPGARHRPGVRGRCGRLLPRRLAVARRPGQRHQQQVQRARRADLLGPARGRRAARRERDFRHSYPHSWRSKAKVIYRCTPQWFIAHGQAAAAPVARETRAEQRWENEGGAPIRSTGTEAPTLRASSRCSAIADTRFVPEKGRNRLGSMVEQRPDWVISRQRAWGVPIALFVDRKTGELLVDREVNQRIVEAIRERGRRRLGRRECRRLPRQGRNPDDYEMVTDILDVWFDSGSHPRLRAGKRPLARRALAGRPLCRRLRPAPRLVPVVAARKLRDARAGRRSTRVLTHGFTMDAKGMKMSKSLGNTVSPIDLMKEYGADILRLWALSRRLHRGPPDRQGNPRRGRRPVSQAPQHLPLSARRARRVQRGGAAGRCRGLSRARALHAPPHRRARPEAAQRGR